MYRLALALGKTLAEIESMSHSEFIGWRAYSLLEPFGSPVDDERAAAQMTLFFSANSEKGTPIPQFFKRWEAPKDNEDISTPELEQKIKGFFKGYQERTDRKKRRKERAAAKQEPTDQEQLELPLNN